MDSHELREVVERLRSIGSDTLDIEAKRATTSLPRRLWESLSSFSNTTGGGVILLGVDEETGFQVSGVRDPGKIQSDLASMCSDMEPPVRAVIQTVLLDDSPVVVAEIPELPPTQKPCYYKPAGLRDGSYVRVADGDRKLTDYEVQLLLSSREQPKFDLELVRDATLHDLDPDLVEAVLGRIRSRGLRSFQGKTREEMLELLNVGRRRDGAFVPTIAGLLALGAYPQQFFPQLNVTFVVYPGLEPGDSGPRGERFLDNLAVDGSIPEMVRGVFAALQRNMKRRSVIAGMGRRDVWEYPETALREAIVNALAHRDLSPAARGTQVQVEMFPNRLSVRNPGGLYGPLSVDTLLDAGISSTRNPALLRLLEDTPLSGTDQTVCENRGSGIAAMVQALTAAAMSPPIFRDAISHFRVSFPNHTLLDDETVKWLEALGQDGMTDTQVFALARMFRGEVLTNSTYRAASSLDSRVAGQELKDLVDRGLVDQHGTRGAATYSLSERPWGPATSTVPMTAEARRAQIRHALAEGPITRRELEDRTGLQTAAVLRYLRQLRDAGQVEQTGRTRSPTGRWRLIQREPSLFDSLDGRTER